jgi:uncharacterized LabA/DUF88 family protein
MVDQLYHLANIRDLLLSGFDERELRRFCYDVPDFRPVYDRLAQNTGKADIVDELLQYAETRLLLDTLLALAKERNPARYEHHGPYYNEDPSPRIRKVTERAKAPEAADTLVLIDGPGLLFAAQEVGATLDLTRLGKSLLQRFGPQAHMHLYISDDWLRPKWASLIRSLYRLNFAVHLPLTVHKDHVDHQIITDAGSLSQDADVVVLLSGDEDFAQLLTSLSANGKRTVVVWLPVVTSRRLRAIADEYINLEELLAES